MVHKCSLSIPYVCVLTLEQYKVSKIRYMLSDMCFWMIIISTFFKMQYYCKCISTCMNDFDILNVHVLIPVLILCVNDLQM